MNSSFLRDMPLGVLIMVLSMFILYLGWASTGYIDLFKFLLSVFFILLAKLLFSVGFHVAKGMFIDVK